MSHAVSLTTRNNAVLLKLRRTLGAHKRQTLGALEAFKNQTLAAYKRRFPGFEDATSFVGSGGNVYRVVGELQLELLKMNGCTPQSHVLEIGCGCLVGGKPIMRYLQPNHYVGIEPNEWLIRVAVRADPEIRALVKNNKPVFVRTTDFDASRVGRRFDFVIAHSILSHAASWQYPQFLKAQAKTLTPTGVIIASIRMSDKNGQPLPDSNSPEWVYPEISSFTWDTVRKVAEEEGFHVEWRKEYREFFTKHEPSHYHDWIVLTKR